MQKTITIEPVTRIEGHAKITIALNNDGSVRDAHISVTQFRGFEKFMIGRPFYEMPSLTARTCGICPVSHLVAASKACDQILSVRIPETANKLRRILNMAQIIQSHALNFFHLSSPDLLLGMDSDPAKRNIFGVMQEHPEKARDGIRLRAFGQTVIELMAGKRIHPSWVVPGGVSEPLSAANRDKILAMLPEALEISQRTLQWYKQSLGQYQESIRTFGNFPTLFLGIVDRNGNLDYYNGRVRVMDAGGKIVADQLAPEDYQDYIGEAIEPWTFLKFPYYKPAGYPQGIYRVGPLARMNLVTQCGTEMADQELAEFHDLERGAVLSTFHYHYARLIEILHCVERIQQLLSEPDILDKHVRAHGDVNSLEGVGMSEAPRGTLIHHYKVDEQGLITWANMIIASGHNNLAMNRSVLQVARQYVNGKKLNQGMLNRVEAVIRAYDPCLACSTHALGQMAMQVELVAPDGEVVDSLTRE
jgi:NAD-reducing hydrogenase large subunit